MTRIEQACCATIGTTRSSRWRHQELPAAEELRIIKNIKITSVVFCSKLTTNCACELGIACTRTSGCRIHTKPKRTDQTHQPQMLKSKEMKSDTQKHTRATGAPQRGALVENNGCSGTPLPRAAKPPRAPKGANNHTTPCPSCRNFFFHPPVQQSKPRHELHRFTMIVKM